MPWTKIKFWVGIFSSTKSNFSSDIKTNCYWVDRVLHTIPESPSQNYCQMHGQLPWTIVVWFLNGTKNDVILPGKVVGLIEVHKEIKFGIHSAIVEDGFDGVSTMQQSFFLHFVLGDKDHIHQYHVGDIVMPLIVFPNYGRNQKTDFISMVPKWLWGKLFAEFINDSWL